MNGARVETIAAFHASDAGSVDRAGIAWLEWGIGLANDLHRLPQNASRRQRRLLSALCARLGTDAGSTTVFVGVDPAPVGSNGLAETSTTVMRTPTMRRVYFVEHDLAPPPTSARPAATVSGQSPDSAPAPAGESTPSAETLLHPEIARRLAALPAAWAAQDSADAVGFSLIRLADDRVSLLELRRRPGHSSEPARPFDAGTIAAMAAVHRACAWACDASPLLGMTSVPGLSPRERETLEHLLAGASEKEVAALLHRSPHTVHSYIKRIYRQLGVRSRAELLAIFVDAGGRN